MELLVAAAMMSVLFVGLGAHLRGGLIVWQQATVRGEALQRRRAAFDRLERDLSAAFMYDDQDSAYGTEAGKLPPPYFGEDRLVFYTVSPSAGSLPAVRVVRYACGEQGGVSGFWRTAQPLAEARAQREPAPERLLDACSNLTLRYAQRSAQREEGVEWAGLAHPSALTPPRLLNVSLNVPGGHLERTCAIPAGILPDAAAP